MTTIYVNPGDNVAEASADLRSGDSLVFRSSLHYGQLEVPCDGVTIAGEEGTKLEGTLPVPNQWEEAMQSDDFVSLAGTGTWRVALPNQPWVLLDESGMIHRLDSDYCNVKQTSGYYYMTAFEALAVPNNARPGPDYGADWWNGIEALWVYSLQDGHLYVRYRDGRMPHDLRFSGGHWDHREPPYPEGSVIYMAGKSGITIAGLGIAGCVDGIAIRDSRNIQIEGCTISGCDFGSRIHGACENIKITNSEFESGLLGTKAMPPIAKTSSENPYPDARLTSSHQYMMWKFWHDESDSTHGSALSIYNSWDESTETVHVPRNIEFAHNNVRCQAFAVDCFGGDGIDIHHNDVRNCWDMGFQRMVDGGRNIQLHDNECHETGYCLMRWHASDQDAGDNYVYNNRVSDIDQVSDFILLGRRPGAEDRPSQLRISLYHNSFSGGNTICMMDGMTSMPGFNAINNVVSNGGMTWVAALWPSDIGAVDYNFVTGQSGRSAAALGAPIKRRDGTLFTIKPTRNQQAASGAIWPSDEIEENFVLPAGHPAKATGIDVSQPFVIDGRTYGPWPGFESGYFEGAAPDRGWINRKETNGGGEVATLTATPKRVAPNLEVTVSWTGSTHPADWIALYGVLAGNDESYHSWSYLNGEHAPTEVVPSGQMAWMMPSVVGSYELRLFSNNSYNLMAKCAVVVVETEEPELPTPGEDWLMIEVWVRKSDLPA